MADELRISPRRRLLKAGTLLAKNGLMSFKCSVRDLSDAGARLLVDDPVGIPEHFELVIELDGLRADCEVVRRKGNEMGVRFTSPVRQGRPTRAQVVTSSAGRPTLRKRPPAT
ncbi:MAG: PilZ domain-containing protein [Hyphomicrobiaceae bacterium]|nr:PilZ domain-containing protein [Hyphomicrobiaceae bacterium]